MALVALPLSLAIAKASGVGPGIGLITAIVGGLWWPCSGVARLQDLGTGGGDDLPGLGDRGKVRGLRTRGVDDDRRLVPDCGGGLTGSAGLMQLIPRPVIAGFLSGIGLTILCTQLPVVLGYEVSRIPRRGSARTALGNAPAGPPRRGHLVAGRSGRNRHDAWPAPAFATTPYPFDCGRGRESASRGISAGPGSSCWAALPSRFPMPGLPAVPWASGNELGHRRPLQRSFCSPRWNPCSRPRSSTRWPRGRGPTTIRS